MSKIVISPAPWEYAPDYDENEGDIILSNAGQPIAIVFKSDLEDKEQYPREQVVGNAKLIAAAPYFLKTLQLIRQYTLSAGDVKGSITFEDAVDEIHMIADGAIALMGGEVSNNE